MGGGCEYVDVDDDGNGGDEFKGKAALPPSMAAPDEDEEKEESVSLPQR